MFTRFFIVALALVLATLLVVGCEHETPVTPPEEQVPNFAATVEDSLFMEVVLNPVEWDSGGTFLYHLVIQQEGPKLTVSTWDGKESHPFHGGYLFTSASEGYSTGWGIMIGSVPADANWGPVLGDHAAKGVAVRCPPGEPLCSYGKAEQQTGGFRIYRKS